MRWDTFLIKEALQIKEKNPPLNNGLKASKESITALIYYKLIDSLIISVCLLTFIVTLL